MAQERYRNQYSTYEPPQDGTAAGFSTPVSWYNDVASGDVGAGTQFLRVMTGQQAYEDLTGMTAPVFNTWRPSQYNVDPVNFRLGDQAQTQYRSLADSAQEREAPTIDNRYLTGQQYGGTAIDGGPQAAFRADQLALANALERRAMSDQRREELGLTGPPSAAEAMQRQGQRAALQNAMAARAANRSGSAGLAQRDAQAAAVAANAETLQQAAERRAREQLVAERQLGGTLSGMRGQDLDFSTQQALLDQQTGMTNADLSNRRAVAQADLRQGVGLANQELSLQQQQLNDDMATYYTQLGFDRDQAQMLARIEMERISAEQQQNYNDIMHRQTESNVTRETAAQGGLMGAVGNFFSGIFSDEDLKEDIDDLDEEDLDDFIRSVEPVSYDYKDFDYLPEGRQYGFIAQDIERSTIGRSLVKDTPQGKAIDTVRGFGAVLAALRRLDDRLLDVEGAAA